MQHPLDDILFGEEATPEGQDAVRAALAQDAALRDDLSRWYGAREALRNNMASRATDRRLLVLYSLMAAGHGADLTDEERQRVSAAWPELSEASKAHPGLDDVARQIEKDRDEFLACWERKRRPMRHMARWSWRIAAVVSLVGFIGVIALVLQQGEEMRKVTVAEGQTERVEFPDGSIMHLVGASEARFDESSFDRHVRLQGRAFFDVNPAFETFTVETRDAMTKVLGTRFGVRSTGGATEVVLESGSVALRPKSAERPVVLRPGEMSRTDQYGPPSDPISVDVSRYLEWTGFLFFQSSPLGDVARRLTDRFGVDVTIDPALLEEGVTGAFEPGDSLEHILRILATTLEASVQGDDAVGYVMRP